MPRALIPNSTQVPDVILDHWMAELSGAEFKVLLYIARRTYGFGKESDSISLSQIAHGITRRDGTVLDRGTGASRSSVARSLKELEERGLVIRTTNLADSGREFQENTYRINLDWEPPSERSGGQASGGGEGLTGVVSSPDYLGSQRDYPVSKNAGGWSRNETTVVSKPDPQETALQETEQETAAPEKPHADADLVETLVREGVGRSAAVRLAQGGTGDGAAQGVAAAARTSFEQFFGLGEHHVDSFSLIGKPLRERDAGLDANGFDAVSTHSKARPSKPSTRS
jgi:hypothetical protein